jgi:hypothetical protein
LYPTDFSKRAMSFRECGSSKISIRSSNSSLRCCLEATRARAQRRFYSGRRAVPLAKTASSSDGRRNIVLLIHQAFTSVLSFHSAASKSWILGTLTRVQRDIWAAKRTCACAPVMSLATEPKAAAGARLERWCRESLNAATWFQEARMAVFPWTRGYIRNIRKTPPLVGIGLGFFISRGC